MEKIDTPLDKNKLRGLRAGQEVLLSGTIYTARDQAHRKLVEAIRRGRKIPLSLRGAVLYYCGPTKTPAGKVIGSCGPTTASRMDAFTPVLLASGLSGMIGKGNRGKAVVAAMKKYGAVYFLAYAGCGALISQYVNRAGVYAFAGLGPEAIYRLQVRDLPLIVGIDASGRSVYDKR